MRTRLAFSPEVRGPAWLLALVVVAACSGPGSTTGTPAPPAGTAMPLDRIAIVGASVSAGFGGQSFGDAFTAAAPRAQVTSAADVMLFRDPLGNSRNQIDTVIAWKPSVIVALDFLFWDIYGFRGADRDAALRTGLAELERARAAGAWIVVGDVPHIVTAAEWMLSKEAVPSPDDLAAFNAEVAAWANGRERVLFVPFAAWADPLAKGDEIALRDGSKVDAKPLMALDGLHANARGVWVILDRLDALIESTHPGTPKDALVFKRPAD